MARAQPARGDGSAPTRHALAKSPTLGNVANVAFPREKGPVRPDSDFHQLGTP